MTFFKKLSLGFEIANRVAEVLGVLLRGEGFVETPEVRLQIKDQVFWIRAKVRRET